MIDEKTPRQRALGNIHLSAQAQTIVVGAMEAGLSAPELVEMILAHWRSIRRSLDEVDPPVHVGPGRAVDG